MNSCLHSFGSPLRALFGRLRHCVIQGRIAGFLHPRLKTISHISSHVSVCRLIDKVGRLVRIEDQVVQFLVAILDNPRFRFHAPVLEALGNLRAKEAIPSFIRFLRHSDPTVRGIANSSLMVTTSKAVGFRGTADEARREAGVQKWEAWWAENAATFQVSRKGGAGR